MDADGFSIFDVENALLAGGIVGRQTDRESRERKYLVQGPSADQATDLVVVVKFGRSDKLVIVTLYANES